VFAFQFVARAYTGDPTAYLFKLVYCPKSTFEPRFEAFPIDERLSSFAVKVSGHTVLGYGNGFALSFCKHLRFTDSLIDRVAGLGTPFFHGSQSLALKFQFPYLFGSAMLDELVVYELAVTPDGGVPNKFEKDYPTSFDFRKVQEVAIPGGPAWCGRADVACFRRRVDSSPAPQPTHGDVMTASDHWGFWGPDEVVWPTFDKHLRATAAEMDFRVPEPPGPPCVQWRPAYVPSEWSRTG
jgi:hypothetical protein